MVEGGIIRSLTEEEKREIIPVGKELRDNAFKKKLAELELKYTKLHKPFCRRCAIYDYKDMLIEQGRERKSRLRSMISILGHTQIHQGLS